MPVSHASLDSTPGRRRCKTEPEESVVKNSKSTLYNDLKRQILTMELGPDAALGEVAISERYGLSRTPVREVFQRLAGDGYVDIRESRGASVIPMNHSTLLVSAIPFSDLLMRSTWSSLAKTWKRLLNLR